ncbi:hypothetical protein [Helicobacter rodentium]|uniref:hypothetical protein n=1 Tax=Helicobacter rodentium TaxID=59617 RepID=UPI0025A5120F|nr:hypothetical protein [Helicobacter rodentium]
MTEGRTQWLVFLSLRDSTCRIVAIYNFGLLVSFLLCLYKASLEAVAIHNLI